MNQQASTPQPQQGATPASPQMGGGETVRRPEPSRPVFNDWASI
ncbi:hypothetical protein [Cereibacter azotoformans]|uniref:Uncharacterized protein n=1 Tax=Cereibacter azotoformans TaxID=43057 RepID=A0A2T5K9A1_9RHOB|nr:hypothetical protein [Cereibacter azotoformans]AXQ93278.1 hypothetical protein D0Z66_05275 [Cereibacter sphaeroides]PTR18996.1 hypothetical protein C8J28_106144 [Cereibacter azotoformans]